MSQQHSQGWYNSRVLFTVLLSIGLLGSIVAPAAVTAQDANSTTDVSEEAYNESAPEPGDEYFEAAADDGSWVSYDNPRDEYRDPYLGEGSGKICTVLLNEAGEPIVGETVPNTTVTVPTGEAIEWHSEADPLTVDYPLTDHYERPLDADQFGTSDDLAQGDGYMDSHCIEFHGPATNETIEYGEATVGGDHADRIEVVGYIQKTGTWESDIEPLEAATSYEEAGGEWTYRESESHGQVVVVLQLAADDPAENETPADSTGNQTTAANNTEVNETDRNGSSRTADEAPGFGIAGSLVAILALVAALVSRQQ
ncbi:MAG: PGF-CTERM sorting domain-containing protein [Halohasta sp.]